MENNPWLTFFLAITAGEVVIRVFQALAGTPEIHNHNGPANCPKCGVSLRSEDD